MSGRSLVRVEFADTGEIREYEISAGKGIARYLASELAGGGALTLWNDATAHVIPCASIRSIDIVAAPEPVKDTKRKSKK